MSDSAFLSFGREQFNRLFPFYLLVGEDNSILAFGDSLKKIFPIKEGALFYDVFTIKRFTTGQDDFPLLKDLQDQVVILNHTSREVHTFLRGEVTIVGGEKPQFLFIGTPWFASVEELLEKNLTVNDFARHDPMVDLLHVLKTQEITTQEIKELLARVNSQRDILKVANEMLQDSENRLSSLVNHLNSGVLLEDDHRRIVVVNPMFGEIFGFQVSTESVVGTDCSALEKQSESLFINSSEYSGSLKQLLGEKDLVLGRTFQLCDGRILELDYIPIRIQDQYKGSLWKYTDVTQRKRYENNLKQQEEKYRRIIENMNLGLIEVDLQDRISYANQSFCNLSGYEPNELLGREATRLFMSETDQKFVLEKMNERRSGVSDSYEICVRIKSGEHRWWHISGAPNYDETGTMVGTIGIHLDITRQKKMEEQLLGAKVKAEDSSKAKENFLANMSHEIRTPLNAIIGMVRELGYSGLDESQQSYVNHAQRASQHLLSIVNNILDISKIEAGQFQLDNRSFNLTDVLLDTEAIMAPAAREKNLEFEVSLRGNQQVFYLGDPNRLRQVLINITSNAIKFTEAGSVSTKCEVLDQTEAEDSIMITITDSGIGMDAAFIKDLFKKFSQERHFGSRHYGGTGLGMAIAHELVELMNGRIEVESTKGHGTTFRIFLRLKKTSRLEQVVLDTRPATSANIKKILLVEDSPLNRLVASHVVKRHGFHVTEAKNGREAIDMLQLHSFDLILMDLEMPVMNGLEATRYLREQLKLTTPVVALTATVFKSEIDMCLQAGMSDYVVKPFEEKLLIEVIQRHTSPNR